MQKKFTHCKEEDEEGKEEEARAAIAETQTSRRYACNKATKNESLKG